jgi:hypothetical protein
MVNPKLYELANAVIKYADLCDGHGMLTTPAKLAGQDLLCLAIEAAPALRQLLRGAGPLPGQIDAEQLSKDSDYPSAALPSAPSQSPA